MRKLLQLLRANMAAAAPKVEASADKATIYVYDAIGAEYGIDPEAFARALGGISAGTIDLRLNSPGGDVFDARAMMTVLKAHSARIVAHIDGLAASAASILMLAADEIVIAPGAFVMIHDPWSLAIGNAADMRQSAELLDKVAGELAADYAAATGKGVEEIRTLMAAETWFTADEAVSAGLATRKAETGTTPKAKAFNLAAYGNAPEALKRRPSNDNFAALAAEHEFYAARLALIERAA